MGAFFTNVQVFCGGTLATDVRSRIARDLEDRILANGRFRELQPGEASERRVVLRARPGDRWVSLYDQVTEDQDVEELDAVLRQVSRSSDAVGVLMHDSDVLSLRLARGGRILDCYCNAPDYFGEVDQEAGGEGNAALWAPLLGDHPPGTLEEAWRSKASGLLGFAFDLLRGGRPDAHAVLTEVTRLLRWDEERAQIGYGDVGDQLAPDDLVLDFRLSSRPAWERAATGAPSLHRDELDVDSMPLPPEVLARLNVPVTLPGNVDQPVELVVTSYNRGRAFTGVRLIGTWDSARLDTSEVEAWSGATLAPRSARWTSDGPRAVLAEVPLEIGAGPLDPSAEAGPGQLDAMIKWRGGSHVIARVLLIPKVPGRIEGTLSVAPSEGGDAAEHRFVIQAR